MAKYIIKVENISKGKVWLDALNYDFYLFLNGDLIPDERVRSYLDEKYHNKVGDNAKFGYYRLYGVHGKKPVMEGWALKVSGNSRYAFSSSIFPDFPVKKFEKMCNEPVFTEREYETVIVMTLELGKSFALTGGKNYRIEGFLDIKLDYKIYRKTKIDDTFVYYVIPDGEDILTYVPTLEDKVSVYYHGNNFMGEIPYTEEAHNKLKEVCRFGASLGDFLSNGIQHVVGMDFVDFVIKALGIDVYDDVYDRALQCRDYLMSTQSDELDPGKALEILGFGYNGLDM